MSEQGELVLLTTVTNDIERSMLMGLLQTEHILALARDARTNSGLKPYLGQAAITAGGLDVNIYVYEKDYEQAKILVDAYQNQGLEDPEEEV